MPRCCSKGHPVSEYVCRECLRIANEEPWEPEEIEFIPVEDDRGATFHPGYEERG